MALGDVRYGTSFTSENGTSYAVEIYDSEYSGASAEFLTTSEGFTLSWGSQGEERHTAIKSSKLTLNCIVEDSEFATLLNDMAGSSELRFKVKVTKSLNTYWLGLLLPDLITIEDHPYPYIATLEFTDGLGRLEKVPYEQTDGSLYSGYNYISSIITNILYNYSGLGDFYSSTSQTILFTSINWYDIAHEYTLNKCPLQYTRVNQDVFKKYEDEEVKAYTCLEVIQHILNTFGARIYFIDTFRIDQWNEIVDETTYYRGFANDGSFTSAGTNSSTGLALTDFTRLSGGQFSFLPALLKAQTVYNWKQGITGNILPRQNKYETEILAGYLIGGGDARLKFHGRISHYLQGTTSTEFRSHYRMKVKLDTDLGTTYYLKNNTNGSGPLIWATLPSYVNLYSDYEIGANWRAFDPVFEFFTPQFDANKTGDVYFQFEFLHHEDVNGSPMDIPSGSTWDYQCNIFSLRIAEDDATSDEEGSIMYTSLQGGATNSMIIDLPETELGDGPKYYNYGALKAGEDLDPASSWYDTGSWTIASSVSYDLQIHEMRTREYMHPQLTAMKVYNGGWRSNQSSSEIQFNRFIEWDGDKWVHNALTLEAAFDTYKGEWIKTEIDRSKNDIKITSEISNEETDKEGTSTSVSSSANTVGARSIRDNGLINWIATNERVGYTIQSLASGVSVTGMNTSALDISLENNQALTLYDSFTNYALDIRIDGAAASGATSITIDAVTPDQDIPSGAYLFINQEDIVYWEDVRIVPSAFDFAGNSDPELVNYQAGGSGTTFKLYEFAKLDEAFFLVQIPHGYKVGWDINVHIHWTPGLRGNEENGNSVAWKLDYSWANINGTFPASSTVDLTDTCDGTDHKHQMTPDVAISGTGKNISSMLLCRIFRDNGDTWATNTSGNLPLLLEIDFHVPMDSLGSRLLAAK